MSDQSVAHLSFTIAQHSVAGVKPENEDAIGIRIPQGLTLTNKGAVAVIADGVSAAEAGKEASETCVHNFLSDYYSTPDSWGVKKSTTQVLTALNRWLFGQGRSYCDAQKGYVSTFSTVIFKSQAAHIFHVGDSRIYRLRDNDLEQLTRDHTTFISDDQSYLARAMGLDVKLDVDYRSVDLDIGDIFFLSTDGIHDFVKDRDIRTALRSLVGEPSEQKFEDCCTALTAIALENSSGDNLSCQILRLDNFPRQTIDDVNRKLSALPFPPLLEPGMILDGYRVERELHASNRSQVYLVSDVDTDARYCMKTPSINFDDDLGYIDRFAMESWIGSRIDNPHVAKVIDGGRSKSCLYYLTDYVDGITLERWIKENPKPAVQDVIYLVQQMVKGIRAFHNRETLHQDIKPGNILIDKNGQIKIIDFGSCFIQGIAEIATPLERGGILGTASYSAPEVVINAKSTVQSDIFSLAVIVYEMLTGEAPFGGKLEECRTSKAYLKTKYIPCYDINPLIPIWIDGAVKKGLRFNPERRYDDVSEFLHELQKPNPKYTQSHNTALLEANPLLFWQATSAVLFVALCISLAF
ncbi:MAG: bifunctional protein-serine/threonine kinase/phosphatase [Gammaproteobacteria bacterium]|nr:bifunctional protein-serine/threonine kinase/phosphatase [Gammaproteobacteria bacterium]MBQ0838925.1 bifunctional protein-serine/threonine kinase/phosphatase [Gammaproteobacteria bacterium]